MDTPSPSPASRPDLASPASPVAQGSAAPAAPVVVGPAVDLAGPVEPGQAELLGPAAMAFLAQLHRRFEAARQARLIARRVRAARFDAGELPDFRGDTRGIREGEWSVAPIPARLQDRRVEITGPVEPKMVINALNSGARVYMADFEDSTAPTWGNLLTGQRALRRARHSFRPWPTHPLSTPNCPPSASRPRRSRARRPSSPRGRWPS